jgi:hypothetical protein
MSAKDDNGYPPIYGVSHLDGVTPIQVHFDPSTRSMLVDEATSIAFDPSINAYQTDSMYPLAKATSSIDNKTVRPWVVNATTGAVLIQP